MYSPELANDILQNFGGATVNMLDTYTNTFDMDNEHHELRVMQQSPYYTSLSMSEFLKTDNNFSIMFLNTGSLLAKIDEIRVFLKECKTQKVNFDCICIQESWLDEKACDDLHNLYQLDGYNCYPQGKYCSSKGGLMIYIKSIYKYKKVFSCPTSKIWEGLFLEVYTPDSDFRIVVGNVYKPPKQNNNNNNIAQFMR